MDSVGYLTTWGLRNKQEGLAERLAPFYLYQSFIDNKIVIKENEVKWMFHLIGVVKTPKLTKIKSYILAVTSDSGKNEVEVKFRDAYSIMNTLRYAEIQNLYVEDGEIKAVGGFDRYSIVAGEKKQTHFVKKAPVVLSKQVVGDRVFGYTLFVPDRGAVSILAEETPLFIAQYGEIANAKVVEKVGLVPFKGSFAEIQLDKVSDKYSDPDAHITDAEFVLYGKLKGWDIRESVAGISWTIPENGLKIDYMKMPSISNGAIRVDGGPLAINKLHCIGNGIRFQLDNTKTLINEVVLDSVDAYRFQVTNMSIVGNVDINKVSNTSRITQVYHVDFRCNVRLIKLSGKLSVQYSIYGDKKTTSVGAVDLSEMTVGSVVNGAFSNLNGLCHVKLGETLDYQDAFNDTDVKLHNFFDSRATWIGGFSNLVGCKSLDFSKFKDLRALESVGGKEIAEIKFPEIERGEMQLTLEDVCLEAPIQKLRIDEKHGSIHIKRSFKRLRELELASGKSLIGFSNRLGDKEFDKEPLRVIVRKVGKLARLPEILNTTVSIEVEEGIRELEFGTVTRDCNGIKLPKSLEVIGSRGRGLGTIKNWNLADTKIRSFGAYFADRADFIGEVVILPETTTYIGDSAFNLHNERRFYIPEGVNYIGNKALNASIVYLYKGSYADKRITGKTVKVYVDSVDDVLELIGKGASTTDKAKIKMVAVDDSITAEWKKNNSDNYMEWMKLRIEALMGADPYVKSIPLNTEKFISFKLENLGEFGEKLKELSGKFPKFYTGLGKGRTSDQFNLLSNLITENTEFIPGAYTLKMLEKYPVNENRVSFLYNDEDSFIAIMDLRDSQVNGILFGHRIIVVSKGVVKFATAIRRSEVIVRLANDLRNEIKDTGLIAGVLGKVVVGDATSHKKFILKSVGMKRVPEELTWLEGGRKYGLKLSLGDDRVLDITSGRIIEIAGSAKSKYDDWVIKDIKEYGEYSLKGLLEKELLDSESMLELFNILNGKPYEPGKVEAKPHFVVGFLKELVDKKITYAEFQEKIIAYGSNGKEKIDRLGIPITVKAFNNEKYAEESNGGTIWRDGDLIHNSTFYIPWGREKRLHSSKVTGFIGWYSAHSLYKNRKELMNHVPLEYNVGDSAKMHSYSEEDRNSMHYMTLWKKPGYMFDKFPMAMSLDDRRVHLVHKGEYLGTFIDTERVRRLVMRTDELSEKYSGIGRVFRTIQKKHLDSFIEEGREAFLIAQKIRRGESLNVEEQRIAAIIAYGIQGYMGEIGFERV